jgi:hypothetical protein
MKLGDLNSVFLRVISSRGYCCGFPTDGFVTMPTYSFQPVAVWETF